MSFHPVDGNLQRRRLSQPGESADGCWIGGSDPNFLMNRTEADYGAMVERWEQRRLQLMEFKVRMFRIKIVTMCVAIVVCLVVLLSGCALHFHYHGTTADGPVFAVDNSNDNASDADARLRGLLGVD